MPINGQSVGKDVTMSIIVNGNTVNIGPDAITGFNPRPRTTEQTNKPLDGNTLDAVFPDGWEGSLDVLRLDSTLEDFWAQLENQYYTGQNVGTGTITETIANPDGSISQWRYTRCVFKLEEAGDRKADDVIKMRLSFKAQRRLKVQ